MVGTGVVGSGLGSAVSVGDELAAAVCVGSEALASDELEAEDEELAEASGSSPAPHALSSSMAARPVVIAALILRCPCPMSAPLVSARPMDRPATAAWCRHM